MNCLVMPGKYAWIVFEMNIIASKYKYRVTLLETVTFQNTK